MAEISALQSPAPTSLETPLRTASGQEARCGSRNLMLIPSLACQAQCRYCFGPNQGPRMSAQVFDAALDWVEATSLPGQSVHLTFHGGEPLLVGIDWYRRALPTMRERLGERLELSVQSNLWLLDDALCELFTAHGVSLGTSLDGPEAINDAQRGAGYYARTMAGIATARRHGLDPGVICTFTSLSAPRYREVFEFFVDQGLSFSVHATERALGNGRDPDLALTSDQHAELFMALFDLYLANITRTRISTLDQMARGISGGKGGLCTFGQCLGHYLTIAPDGAIYPCNRLVQHVEWQLGWVQERRGLDDLADASAWQRLRARELTAHEDCGDCPHVAYCQGGCPYNALVGGTDRRDPGCAAYRRIFDHITTRALDEVFSEQNLDSVVAQGTGKHGLLHKGPLLQIMRGGPHPAKVAARAREVLAAVALAASASPEEALGNLERAGAVSQPARALHSLRDLRRRLDHQAEGLVNAYLHVTYACNLACAHCYASAGKQHQETMAAPDTARLVGELAEAGFSKVVITGGEPLMHPQADELLGALATLRGAIGTAQIVLRTNLAYPLSSLLIERLLASVDQIVVSLDGDQATHDARRGAGTYVQTVTNLRSLLAGRAGVRSPAKVSLAATLSAEQASGPPGESVHRLAQELGVSPRIKPVLPLGRGAELDIAPECYSSHEEEGAEALACAPAPRATCGLGMNLYVDPAGVCYPCYTLMGPTHALGNVLCEELAAVLARNDAYRSATVDSNRRCRLCALRYLCGGLCHAWSIGEDADAPPHDCAPLHARAHETLVQALETLQIPWCRWQAAGLPLPVAPPDIV